MNIHFPQVDKRSQLSSYFLAAFAICTAMMLILSFGQFFEQRWSMPSGSSQVVPAESTSVPVAIPAPLPPQDQIQISVTPLRSVNANPVPQAVPVPAPSVP